MHKYFQIFYHLHWTLTEPQWHFENWLSLINWLFSSCWLFIPLFSLDHLYRRSRPTLKPAGSIVSKATEFVDIYRFPPSRPEPLYPQPTPDKTAAKCRKDVCLLPDCSCGGKDIPGIYNKHNAMTAICNTQCIRD